MEDAHHFDGSFVGKMGIFYGYVSSPGEYPSLLESDMFSYKCHLGHFDIAAMRPKRGVFRDARLRL